LQFIFYWRSKTVKPEKVDYRIQRQCSRQWRSLLAALAQECTTQTEPIEPRELMRRIGMRFATQTPLAPCENLEQLQHAMCEVWKDMDWGRVDLEEHDRVLRIVHHDSNHGSLGSGAFGDATATWAPACLEGVYQKWLATLGAGDALRVVQIGEPDEFGSIEYQLSL
jgi:hypothetical protein